jgi:hypothetical protein
MRGVEEAAGEQAVAPLLLLRRSPMPPHRETVQSDEDSEEWEPLPAKSLLLDTLFDIADFPAQNDEMQILLAQIPLSGGQCPLLIEEFLLLLRQVVPLGGEFCLPAGDLGDAAAWQRRAEDSRCDDAAALELPAGLSDAQGKRHRR